MERDGFMVQWPTSNRTNHVGPLAPWPCYIVRASWKNIYIAKQQGQLQGQRWPRTWQTGNHAPDTPPAQKAWQTGKLIFFLAISLFATMA